MTLTTEEKDERLEQMNYRLRVLEGYYWRSPSPSRELIEKINTLRADIWTLENN